MDLSELSALSADDEKWLFKSTKFGTRMALPKDKSNFLNARSLKVRARALARSLARPSRSRARARRGGGGAEIARAPLSRSLYLSGGGPRV